MRTPQLAKPDGDTIAEHLAKLHRSLLTDWTDLRNEGWGHPEKKRRIGQLAQRVATLGTAKATAPGVPPVPPVQTDMPSTVAAAAPAASPLRPGLLLDEPMSKLLQEALRHAAAAERETLDALGAAARERKPIHPGQLVAELKTNLAALPRGTPDRHGFGKAAYELVGRVLQWADPTTSPLPYRDSQPVRISHDNPLMAAAAMWRAQAKVSELKSHPKGPRAREQLLFEREDELLESGPADDDLDDTFAALIWHRRTRADEPFDLARDREILASILAKDNPLPPDERRRLRDRLGADRFYGTKPFVLINAGSGPRWQNLAARWPQLTFVELGEAEAVCEDCTAGELAQLVGDFLVESGMA